MSVEKSGTKANVLQIVKLKSTLSEDDAMKIAHERAEQFKKVPGLVQKYYVRTGGTGEYGGVYFWESMEALQTFRASELAATIPSAYKVAGPPEIAVHEIIFQLRD